MLSDQIPSASPVKVRIEGVAGVKRHAPVAYPDAIAALRWMLRLFADQPTATSGRIWSTSDLHDAAALYPLANHRALIVGDSATAALVRDLLPRFGWHMHLVPTPGTPLVELRTHLNVRTLNQLVREGFTCTEQIAALPDATLLAIRGFGALALETVRRALATLKVFHYPDNTRVVLDARQVRELDELLETLAAYADARGQGDVRQRAARFVSSVLHTAACVPPAGEEETL